MRLGLSFFVKEVILFGLTLGLGLYTARYYSFYFGGLSEGAAISFTLACFVVLLVVLGAIFFIARYKKVARFSFRIFLILVVFSGAQVVLGTFLSSPWNLSLAFVFVLIFFRGKNVLFHNLGIIFGISGVGAVFGLSISVEVGLILLVALSLYDIVAVYVTKHMITLARSMVESGSVFGFLIPFEFRGFLYGKDQAKAGVGENFMILGSGDIGLPLLFLSSLVKISLASAFVTAGFSLLGLFVTHILFINQGQRRAMAALPPIATATVIGYLISQLL